MSSRDRTGNASPARSEASSFEMVESFTLVERPKTKSVGGESSQNDDPILDDAIEVDQVVTLFDGANEEEGEEGFVEVLDTSIVQERALSVVSDNTLPRLLNSVTR